MNSSLFELLSDVYPEYEWLPWKFPVCPQHYWDDIKHQRKFIDYAEKELKINDKSDWYSVTIQVHVSFTPNLFSIKDLINLGGALLLKRYNNSLVKLLSKVYPDHSWLPWKFTRPQNLEDVQNQKQFADWVTQELKLKDMSDWYRVSIKVPILNMVYNKLQKDLEKVGGKLFLKLNHNSIFKLVSEVYPEYNWLPSKFHDYAPKSLVTNPDLRRDYVEWIAKQTNVKDMKDWYNIKAEVIDKC